MEKKGPILQGLKADSRYKNRVFNFSNIANYSKYIERTI